ncbi:hypothetical protein LIER_06746 [Lithospermum erythrorhizon]|uniref:Uncharacterized protein n=1 Tax=Lithospermum erythrorhizon TaxID=34254 RepID=A0AAV3P9F4_LITER
MGPKAYDLLVKAGYDPKECKTLGKLSSEDDDSPSKTQKDDDSPNHANDPSQPLMIYPQRQGATTRRNPKRKSCMPQKPKDLGCKTSDIKLPSRNKNVWQPKEQGNKNITLHITVEEGET